MTYKEKNMKKYAKNKIVIQWFPNFTVKLPKPTSQRENLNRIIEVTI